MRLLVRAPLNHYPCIGYQASRAAPSCQITLLSKSVPLFELRRFAREHAVSSGIPTHLLLGKDRYIVFYPDGSQSTCAGRLFGYRCVSLPGWNGEDNEVVHDPIIFDH